MIRFELRKSRSGRRSRWAKKYPRKKILNRGDEKYVGWFRHNWYDDRYSYFHGSIIKFLRSNLGRPVDKVFSEFLDRCDKSVRSYNLRKWFYGIFENKSDIGCSGGFYLSNGIVNYKRRTKCPKYESYVSIEEYNKNLVPDITSLCKKYKDTHIKQFVGRFKLSRNVKKDVYLIDRDEWESNLVIQSKYKLCSVYGVGKGVSEYTLRSQDKMNRTIYVLWNNYSWDKLPKFVFITKI